MRELLRLWGDIEVVGRLGGGHRNEVLEVRRDGERLVARRSRRSAAALDWELDLLDFLAGHGFTVPAVVPAPDGRRHVRGVVVQRWLPGRPPGDDDWSRVAGELARLHALTRDWPQRPGFRSTAELLHRVRGGDVDLTAMPPTAVAACRRAWRRLADVPRAVVHGDPCPANIRVTGHGVGFLDWDESRVDHITLDLADFPVPVLAEPYLTTTRAALDAWEAANGWSLEPSYARDRLARLTAADGE
ncbi:phosphotransferase enzyme family protein [Wenjunlia vitaminophila]|uniref:phosphotransferase enzyme family protein n=1 Tax=Wenjunlia vitaminophila TaxID=76728 RepID=UPI00039E5733|nr:phosphotransferase [Wenjunlia vitaminophila]